MTGNRYFTEEGTVPLDQQLPWQQQSPLPPKRNMDDDDGDHDDDTGPPPSPSVLLLPPPPSNSSRSFMSTAAASSVQVAVRVRPLLSLESGASQCVTVGHCGSSKHSSMIRIGGSAGPTFTFDQVFDKDTTQQQVFEHRVATLVDNCLEGYNATILAYGQTGSGKTHTIMGPNAAAGHDPSAVGIIPRAVESLFQQLQDLQQQHQNNQQQQQSTRSNNNTNTTATQPMFDYEVRVQFLELYGEEIRDLLASQTNAGGVEKLTIRDIGNDEPEVVGATSHKVESAEEALRCLTRGMLRRVTASTAMNESSSRSHAILSIMIDQTRLSASARDPDAASSTTTTVAAAEDDTPQVVRSKFNFVDLAGSERQKRTLAEGKRLKEGIDINKGLLVLGNVISALGDPKKRGKAFVPYRDSKLTRLLKGSLGGNHKTLMIACVSPSATNMEESLNCLRYANRAKNIQNHAVVNVDAKSRLVAELRVQVQALAADLLLVKETGDLSVGTISKETLLTLANGGQLPPTMGSTSPIPSTVPPSPFVAAPPSISRLVSPPIETMCDFDDNQHHHQQQQSQDTEAEMDRTRNLLRRARRDHETLEERLHATQAERELYRLQLSAFTDTDETICTLGNTEQLFLERAKKYELEISELREELRELRTLIDDDRNPQDTAEPLSFSITEATKSLEADRVRLEILKHDLGSPRGPASPDRDSNDDEETLEQEKIDTLAIKYSVDDDDEASPDEPNVSLPAHRRAQIEADLLEISRIIDSKEELISQLQCSQAKYSSMKEFYEGKLHQMEKLLDEKEEERERLRRQLELLKNSNSDTSELEERLRKQEEQISGIRRQKKQLKDLTSVSSKNAEKIDKLQNDVEAMKQTKVSMQKQLSEERKAHAFEIRKLQKEVMQKDRETRKWHSIASQKGTEAEKASQMAKAKTEQLGLLRSRYKDAEKKIRVLSLKRGVMEKAGLDSVMVGRRETGKAKRTSKRADDAKDDSHVDVESLGKYFEKRVTEVSRKEAIADKLAHEWEEHFELTTQRAELEKQTDSDPDALQAIDLRIQYEEDRIRKLANRLGKPDARHADENTSKVAPYLFGVEYSQICKGAAPQTAAETAAKVLFGLVVRERRRVAALAKTASSLDEKLQASRDDIEAKEAAFRAYIDDSQNDIANLSQNHQEQILSLMALVKGGDVEERKGASVSPPRELKENSKLLVLANERISGLEEQLHELKSEKKTIEVHRRERDHLKSALTTKEGEYLKLESRLRCQSVALAEILDVILNNDLRPAELRNNILQTIDAALRDTKVPSNARTNSTSTTDFKASTFLAETRKRLELSGSADGDDDDDDENAEEETPDWADEIMADLALIAEGLMPPSLQDLPSMEFATSQSSLQGLSAVKVSHHDGDGKKSVFDRLTDPLSYTGIQKQKVTMNNVSDGRRNPKLHAAPSEKSPQPMQSKGTPERGKTNSEAESSEKDVTERATNFSNLRVNSKSSIGSRASASSYSSKADAAQERMAEKMLDDLLQPDPDHSQKVEEYTQQNVFERLQKTTTTSFAVKHPQVQARHASSMYVESKPETPEAPAEAAGHSTLNSDVPNKCEKQPGNPAPRSSDNKSQGLIRRTNSLPSPKSSTEGKPVREHPNPQRAPLKPRGRAAGADPKKLWYGSPPKRDRSPPRFDRTEQYTAQNVFERLTRTTTEAYAVKQRPAQKS